MRILLLNQYFDPDVAASAQRLTDLAEDLAAHHEVTVIAGRPNFVDGAMRTLVQREQHEGVEILRVRNLRFTKASLLGRGLGLVSYLFLALWAGLFVRRPDASVY